MATLSAAPTKTRSDDIFFPAMAFLILSVVLFGFGQSYFLAGMVFARLPNALVHIHGALFVSWIFLLLAQNILIFVHRVRWHMTLGTLGVILPPLMVVFGLLVVFDSIKRNGTGIPAELILVGDLEELSLFAGITAWGLLARRNAAAHKRLMLLGTMAMLGPAINRWPFPPGLRLPGTIGLYAGLPLLFVVYDLWSLRRVHRATWIPWLLMAAGIFTLLPLSGLNFWHQCVLWIQR